MEEEDGLETLENLQYNQNEVIASKATQLVRKYYGDVCRSSSRVCGIVCVHYLTPIVVYMCGCLRPTQEGES